MRPGAQIQSAIELLDEIEDAAAPADKVVNRYFRRRRYAGSGDRAAITDLVYGVLRRRAELDWWLAQGGMVPDGAPPANRHRVLAALCRVEGRAATEIAALFGDGPHAPAGLEDAEHAVLAAWSQERPEAPPDWARHNYPEWLDEALKDRFGGELGDEMRALNERAPVDLRVNQLKGDRDGVLARLRADGVAAEPCRLSPVGIRLAGPARLADHAVLRTGLAEVQDEGSQLVALLADARPGAQVVDLCAGAGGKTLALAAAMANRGQIYACDSGRARLARLAPRLSRAGVRNAQTRRIKGTRDPWLDQLEDKADRVLIDVPCSGSGTWRRNPDAKWRLDPAMLASHVEAQRDLLAGAPRLVRPGGRLIYATCSLLGCENEAQIAWFLERRPDFRLLPIGAVWGETVGGDCPSGDPMLMLTPWRHGVDGFFVAVLERAGH